VRNHLLEIEVLTSNLFTFITITIMQKTESIWHFWEFTAVNSWYRNSSGTTEVTEIFRFSDYLRPLGVWKYHWINRPWQRYDYESSLDEAFGDLLSTISWSQYESWREDIEKIRLALKKMENYEWTPRN